MIKYYAYEGGIVYILLPVGMAEVLEYKAAGQLELTDESRRRQGELRCSGTQEGGRGSDPSVDQVGQAESDQLKGAKCLFQNSIILQNSGNKQH